MKTLVQLSRLLHTFLLNAAMKKAFCSLLLLFCVGCTYTGEKETLHADQVEYVTAFPSNPKVTIRQLEGFDLAGCVNFCVADTFLVASYLEKGHFLEVYSTVSKRLLFTAAPKGHGRNEVPEGVGEETVRWEDGRPLLDYVDMDNYVLYTCDLLASADSAKAVLTSVHFENATELSGFVYTLSDSTLLINQYLFTHYVPIVYDYRNDTVIQVPPVGNLHTLEAGEDGNTLSAVRCVNRERGLAVEAMLRLNQVNLFAADSSFSKTLCMGDELMNVREIDHEGHRKVNKQFADASAQPGYFAVLYQNISYRDDSEGKGESAILLFDWEGKPLEKVQMPCYVFTFDISEKGELYVMTQDEEGNEQLSLVERRP